MRIALFTDTYPPQINGVAVSTYNLAHTLISHGHQVIIVAPNTAEAKFEYKDGIIKIPGFELKKLYGYRGTWIYSSKGFEIIKNFKPEIIHCQDDAPIGQFSRICARKLNVPFVYTYHTEYENYTYYVTHGYFDRIAKKVIKSYSKYLTKISQELITPSIKTKEMLRSYGADSHISVIPTGIDFSLFKKENLDQVRLLTLKRDLHIKDDDFVFLVLGRLAKEKSMDVSIQDFAAFVKKYPKINSKMIVVGGGPYQNYLEMLAEKLNVSQLVTFVGPVPSSDVGYYYHLANIYTSASMTETQGLTFMEAMAAGTIVLAKFADNLAETIQDNDTGFFFTSQNSFIDKAYQIYQMKEEESIKLKQNALKAIDKYSIETFYEKIMEVYKRGVKSLW